MDTPKSLKQRFFANLADQRGASLVEIMIAVLILSFVSLGMVEFFASGRIGFDREEHRRVATLLAQEALERTVALPFPQITTWSEQRTVSRVVYTTMVTSQNNAPDIGMKTVQSSVTWNATPTSTRTVSLLTYVNQI